MRVKLLGSFEIRSPTGAEITPSGFKVRSLLALLCLNAGRVVSADQLVRSLWDRPPRTAATAVQVYVSQLRKLLDGAGIGGSVLTTRAPGYLMDAGRLLTDRAEFESLVTAASVAEAGGAPERASELLGQALALWGGPALGDLRSLAAVERMARQIDERRIVVCERRLGLELGLGRLPALIGEIYGLIESFPSWENLYYYLMIALYQTGRTADALRAYQQLRETMVDALGMEPSARLRQLHRSVLAREEWLDGKLGAPAPVPVPV
ncbi:AfsR/SARP family transcriptional regulator [Amycolatopsis sp. NPDC005003]